jgi:hypothetical protein
MKKNNNQQPEGKAGEGQLITRKQAIKKSGYMALSVATMMLLLNKNAQAASPGPAAPTNTSPNKPDGIWND